MKTSIIGFYTASLLLIMVMLMGASGIRDAASQDLEEGLNNAVNTTIHALYDQQKMKAEDAYNRKRPGADGKTSVRNFGTQGVRDINSNAEYLAAFQRNMERQFSSRSDRKVRYRVYGCDYHTGFLDVRAVMQYRSLLGGLRTEECRRTALIECDKEFWDESFN